MHRERYSGVEACINYAKALEALEENASPVKESVVACPSCQNLISNVTHIPVTLTCRICAIKVLVDS